MTNNQEVIENLVQFNNRTFTKKQWTIILNGCGCPKSALFWIALRNNNFVQYKRAYTLVDMNSDAYNLVLEKYNTANRAYVKKFYEKVKARKRAEERKNSFKGITFYMVGGALTTERPEIEQ